MSVRLFTVAFTVKVPVLAETHGEAVALAAGIEWADLALGGMLPLYGRSHGMSDDDGFKKDGTYPFCTREGAAFVESRGIKDNCTLDVIEDELQKTTEEK